MNSFRSAAVAATLIASCGLPATAQLELIFSQNLSNSGSMNSVGFNPALDEVVVHTQSGAVYEVYDRTGQFLRTIPKPLPGGNDDDIEFAGEAVTIAGVVVPANSLLSIENDSAPARIFAVDSAGTVLAQQSFGSSFGNWVGGAYHHDRNTFFIISWTNDVVYEMNADTGALVNSFTINPVGATQYDVFFGDLDVFKPDGNLYIVSSSQNRIRIMSPDGLWLGDADIASLGIAGMSCIAFDDACSEAWMCSTNSFVYQVGGFEPLLPCTPDLADDFGNTLVRDRQVTFGDFLALLGYIGPCPGGTVGCDGDIADDFGFPGSDGNVTFGDFLYLLGQIGPCP